MNVELIYAIISHIIGILALFFFAKYIIETDKPILFTASFMGIFWGVYILAFFYYHFIVAKFGLWLNNQAATIGILQSTSNPNLFFHIWLVFNLAIPFIACLPFVVIIIKRFNEKKKLEAQAAV